MTKVCSVLEGLSTEGVSLLAEVEASLVLQSAREGCRLHRAHVVAIRNWLGKYEVPIDALGDERVRGYLEAYYHLRAIGAWKQAVRMRRLSLRVKKDEAVQKWQKFEQSFATVRVEEEAI